MSHRAERTESPLSESSFGGALFVLAGVILFLASLEKTNSALHEIEAILLIGFGGLYATLRVISHRIHKTLIEIKHNQK